MTASAGHIREISNVRKALTEAITLVIRIRQNNIAIKSAKDIPSAIKAEHLALASAAYLKAIVTLLEQGEGSRARTLFFRRMVPIAGTELRFKPKYRLRNSIFD
jgi:hypothetical protein